MKKSRRITFNVDIYNCTVHVFYGTEYKEYGKYIKKLTGYGEFMEEVSAGRCIRTPCRNIFIWTNKRKHSLLAHEIFHAAENILESCDIKLTDESTEAYAYLIEMITRKVLGS